MMKMQCWIAVSLFGIVACGEDEAGVSTGEVDGGAGAADVVPDGTGGSGEEDGGVADVEEDVWEGVELTGGVGRATLDWGEGSGEVRLEVWYPTAELGGAEELWDLEEGERSELVRGWIEEGSGGDCVSSGLGQVRGAEPLRGEWDVVVFSHCYGCARWSSASVALALVREGYVVVGVEHGGTTMWDREAGTLEPLDDLTLEGRIGEVREVMDGVVQIVAGYVREGWRPRMIAWGHSMGVGTMVGASAGREDVLGIVAHAAPLENPLFSPTLEDVRVPVMMLLAGEDNSILEVGNRFMRLNFERLAVRGWLVEVADAGHWSFSDVPGLVEELVPGCGDAVRQTNGEPFSYLAPAEGRRLAAEWTVFFVNEVSGRSAEEPGEGSGVLVVRREQGE